MVVDTSASTRPRPTTHQHTIRPPTTRRRITTTVRPTTAATTPIRRTVRTTTRAAIATIAAITIRAVPVTTTTTTAPTTVTESGTENLFAGALAEPQPRPALQGGVLFYRHGWRVCRKCRSNFRPRAG